MKERKRSRGWCRFALVALLALGLAAPAGLLLDMALPAPASANEELHPGGRLFFPAWDVRGARLSFMIITRLPLFTSDQDADGHFVGHGTKVEPSYDFRNNCLPGHTTPFPPAVFDGFPFVGPGTATDDVHLEWYGKSCEKDDEILKMSCADIDLIFLNAGNLKKHYNDSKGDQQGALDVHFTVNGQGFRQRVLENSLMGEGVIADPTEGWALAYPAAAAKATFCDFCSFADGGSKVGYEPFPVEVFIPWAFADDSQFGIENLLYLWGPTLFPGDTMPEEIDISWFWYDGRERRFTNSSGRHAFVDNLKNLDPQFQVTSFTCSTAPSSDVAENDGAPLSNTVDANAAGGCSGSSTPDTSHTSDNDQTISKGFTSTSIGWWDILKVGETPTPLPDNPLGAVIQKRGLVGVVAATIPADGSLGNGDAIRLWHKDPCALAPQLSFGPPHLRDRTFNFFGGSDLIVGFNLLPFAAQGLACHVEIACLPGQECG